MEKVAARAKAAIVMVRGGMRNLAVMMMMKVVAIIMVAMTMMLISKHLNGRPEAVCLY